MANEYTITDYLKSDDFKDKLTETAKNFALPALLATVGSGAVGGYLASKNKIDFESPKERRKRILKSILFPAITGGAVAGLAGGASLLSDIDTEKIDKKNVGSDDSILDFAAKNLLTPLGAGIGFMSGGGSISIPAISSGKGTNKITDALMSFGVQEKDGKEVIDSVIGRAGNIRKAINNLEKKYPIFKNLHLNKAMKVVPRVKTKSDIAKALGLTILGGLVGNLGDKATNTLLY